MKLRFTERANRELSDAADYLIARNPAAARRLADALEHAFALIRESPGIGRKTTMGVRVFVLVRFPYKVFYENDSETVTVISIFHAARNPEENIFGE